MAAFGNSNSMTTPTVAGKMGVYSIQYESTWITTSSARTDATVTITSVYRRVYRYGKTEPSTRLPWPRFRAWIRHRYTAPVPRSLDHVVEAAPEPPEPSRGRRSVRRESRGPSWRKPSVQARRRST